MRSMRARLLAAFFFIILINSVLLVTSLLLGYSNSKKYWNVLLEQESRKVVMEFLTRVLQQGGQLNKENSRKILESSSTTLIGSAQIFLFSPEGDLLHSWINPILDKDSPEMPEFQKAEIIGTPQDTKGYVQIIPLYFNHVKHNNIFISHLARLFSLGLLVSIGFSLMLATRISGTFTKEARETARSLINLAEGSRCERFESTPTRELSSINKAAGSLQRMLISEEERRNRWSLSIAHDLRTPLTALRTQFSAYHDGALVMTPDRWKKIMEEINVMEGLTRDFMILGELDATRGNMTVKKVKTESIRKYIMDSLKTRALSQGAAIEWKEELSYLYCDFNLTCRALEALVKNALQHILHYGTVKIIVGGTSESPQFQIYNPGHIPEEHLPHIFDPLYKSDKSRKKEGNGLGLTISQKIAEYHNGSLMVQNLPDDRVCSTFSLNLG